MRHALLLVVALVGVTVLGVLFLRNGGSPDPGGAALAGEGVEGRPGDRGPDPATAAELARLREELRALRAEVQELRRTSGASLRSRPAGVPLPLGTDPASSDADPAAGAITPREALARLVASYHGTDEGLEYYRLLVQAHVPELVDEVLALVLDPRGHVPMRTDLAELLGDPRLVGTRRVVEGLLNVACGPRDPGLAWTAVHALTRVARAGDAPELERRWWRVEFPDARSELLAHVLSLAGDDPNPVVARLLPGAGTSALRAELVPHLDPNHTDTALPVFQAVRGLEVDVRLAGAHRVHAFRSEDFRRLVDDWRGTEPDEAVREALGVAAERLASVPNHHPEQATGEPDVPQVPSDDVHAWAPKNANGGAEWLEVTFPAARRATGLEVHQNCGPGAIVRVEALLADGTREVVWEGAGSGTTAGAWQVPISPGGPVRGLRLALDTARVEGWNEVDAVRLLSPQGDQWASGARASSHYGMDGGPEWPGGWPEPFLQDLQIEWAIR